MIVMTRTLLLTLVSGSATSGMYYVPTIPQEKNVIYYLSAYTCIEEEHPLSVCCQYMSRTFVQLDLMCPLDGGYDYIYKWQLND